MQWKRILEEALVTKGRKKAEIFLLMEKENDLILPVVLKRMYLAT